MKNYSPKTKYCVKKAYHSIEQAKEVRKTLKYRGRFNEMKIYRCNNCHKYHLTTTGY